MTTNEEVREFAKTLDVDDPAMELPREDYYRVMAARPASKTEPVTLRIKGYYHALYARDRIEEECGYAGVTFHVEEVAHDLSDEEQEMLERIRDGDAESLNGGHYVATEFRDVAESLVEKGEVVRFENTAGVSPQYVPVDSDNFSDDRLERMSERQSDNITVSNRTKG